MFCLQKRKIKIKPKFSRVLEGNSYINPSPLYAFSRYQGLTSYVVEIFSKPSQLGFVFANSTHAHMYIYVDSYAQFLYIFYFARSIPGFSEKLDKEKSPIAHARTTPLSVVVMPCLYLFSTADLCQFNGQGTSVQFTILCLSGRVRVLILLFLEQCSIFGGDV